MVTLGWISNNMVPPYISKKVQDGVKSKLACVSTLRVSPEFAQNLESLLAPQTRLASGTKVRHNLHVFTAFMTSLKTSTGSVVGLALMTVLCPGIQDVSTLVKTVLHIMSGQTLITSSSNHIKFDSFFKLTITIKVRICLMYATTNNSYHSRSPFLCPSNTMLIIWLD